MQFRKHFEDQNLSVSGEDSKFSTWRFCITVNQSLMKLIHLSKPCIFLCEIRIA